MRELITGNSESSAERRHLAFRLGRVYSCTRSTGFQSEIQDGGCKQLSRFHFLLCSYGMQRVIMSGNRDIQCILFCEFHPVAGPKIVHQVRANSWNLSQSVTRGAWFDPVS